MTKCHIFRQRDKILRNRKRHTYPIRNYNLLRSKLNRQFVRVRIPLMHPNLVVSGHVLPRSYGNMHTFRTYILKNTKNSISSKRPITVLHCLLKNIAFCAVQYIFTLHVNKFSLKYKLQFNYFLQNLILYWYFFNFYLQSSDKFFSHFVCFVCL